MLQVIHVQHSSVNYESNQCVRYISYSSLCLCILSPIACTIKHSWAVMLVHHHQMKFDSFACCMQLCYITDFTWKP